MTKNRVAIIHNGLSNIDSIRRAVEECGGLVTIVDGPEGLRGADRVILPGVGAFTDGIRRLREGGIDEALRQVVLEEGAPFLGICLGMQLLAELGTEGGKTQGLGWFPARVERLAATTADRRVPHVGWNEVFPKNGASLFKGIDPGTDFYFVHSFHVVCEVEDDVAARTPYCGEFSSAIGRGHVFGVQFHPEKSQRAGFRVLSNFLAC